MLRKLDLFSPVRLGWVFSLFMVWILNATALSVQAGEGNAISLRGNDLLITVDYRWTGTSYGGYFPIRFQVENQGPECSLSFRFEPLSSQPLPDVERRDLVIGTSKTVKFTLSIPMVARGAVGKLQIERDGQVLEQFTRQISLSSVKHDDQHTSILIISDPPQVDVSPMVRGISNLTGRGYETGSQVDHQFLEPLMLPNSWTDYSGLDVVMIPMNTLSKLETDKRSAILKWAQTGGTLLIYNVGQPIRNSQELQDLLKFPDADGWVAPDLNLRPLVQEMSDDPDVFPRWPFSREVFAKKPFLLGTVYAFPANPFPGNSQDWAWWWITVPESGRYWEARYGIHPRRVDEDFFNFLIPGVTSVPVIAFVILMTLFTICIGPLNYILLRRRKRTYLLLLTIPAIACATSVTLFLYSTLSYGFDVASRSRSLTVLDQRTSTAVSIQRLSLFAGMAPSDGLNFSPDTAVFPIWPTGQFGLSRMDSDRSKFESGRTIWGEKQELSEGWLRSRTRTQFVTVQHRTERGRLEIETASGGNLQVSNGLEWDIEALLWMDEKGAMYHGENLAAGNSGELTRIPEDDPVLLRRFVQLLRRHPLEFPDDLAAERTRRPKGYRLPNPAEQGKPAKGLMESKIEQFKELPIQQSQRQVLEILPVRSYLAVLKQRPAIELGLEDTDERAGYHLLLGYY